MTETDTNAWRRLLEGPNAQNVEADYTQLDLCMVMYVSPEYQYDAYIQAASEIFGVPVDEVTPAQRRLAKERSFAACYGGRQRPWLHGKTARVTEHYFLKYRRFYPGA
jgi:DNA polymerase-1